MIEQGTTEWRMQRLGLVTASRVADILAKTKSGYSASRLNYEAQLIVERLTGEPVDGFVSEAMLHGINTEAQARAFYELETGNTVQEVGFILHNTIKDFGCSSDGFVGDDGLIEIKCRNTANHLKFLLNEKIPEKYVIQINAQMEVTGRKWCDFVSFDPRLPAHLQMKIVRVERDDSLIAEIKDEVVKFLGELNEKLTKLEAL